MFFVFPADPNNLTALPNRATNQPASNLQLPTAQTENRQPMFVNQPEQLKRASTASQRSHRTFEIS